ncbi:hypothetical protein AVEN_21718-1 [Araneus ventricosus]|uniref:Sushi domain-containing protein n=1 Tax=Araneus ventricosus TaxID=182803 RepID=A0A4Y2IYL9_ARAVE|nr:hypothetical protein AVEN_21718-1 [Araneus ventricosus]
MSNAALFLEIYFIAIWITAAFASCLNSITCPCGSSKVNYTHCIDDALHKKYSCERWTNCQTCKANSMDCATCPASRFGPICTEAEEKITKGNHVLFGSCPQMKDIFNGQATCIRKEKIRQCKGSCLPGHSFEGMEGAQTITLVCNSNIWVPLQQFPPCKLSCTTPLKACPMTVESITLYAGVSKISGKNERVGEAYDKHPKSPRNMGAQMSSRGSRWHLK